MVEVNTTVAVGNTLLYLTTLGSILGVAVYSRVPWWRTMVGRSQMLGMGALTSILTVVSIRNAFGPFPGYDILRLVTFAAVGLAVWWQFGVLVRIRRLVTDKALKEKRQFDGNWR